MFDLGNRRALVTGASGGIGGAVASALHGQGAAVAFAARNREALEERAAALGDRVHVLTADLADPEAADGLAKAAAEAMGGIDILVNDAGLARDNLFVRVKDEDWQTVLDVNLTAGFRLARAVLRGMMRARWGRIVAITSIVGQTGNPGQANYAASKAGMTGMTKALAAEVAARNITVNCVSPAAITPMTETIRKDERFESKYLERICLGRWGEPEEMAAGFVFLASDEASYVTGEVFTVASSPGPAFPLRTPPRCGSPG